MAGNGILRAALKGMGQGGRGTSKPKAEKEAGKLEDFGVLAVGIHSDDDALAKWEDELYHDQDDLLYELEREWRHHLHYVAGDQHIVYHRERRQWIVRKDLAWRIRSQYNVLRKAVGLRVSRLTENKPTVTVQSATTDRGDVEKTEYKETLFWYLWDKLSLHQKLVRARRWATKCRAGFLVVGWDPDGGDEHPVTRMVLRTRPVTGPDGMPVAGEDGEPVTEPSGVEEVYCDAEGNELGPVEVEEEDPDRPGQTIRVRQDPPEGTASYCEGEAFVDVDGPSAIRFDKYCDDIAESWFVQRTKLLPISRIVGLFGEKVLAKLQMAEEASAEDKRMHWVGLVRRPAEQDILYSVGGGRQDQDRIDREFLVRETWIFPRNQAVKRLWGKDGALLITIGGTLVAKGPLPKWAREACPFVQIVDGIEEGNHYGSDFLSDLVPLQDDINRTRSMMAERVALLSRLLIGAPQNHQMNLSVLGGLPGMLLSYRQGAKPEAIKLDNGNGTEVQQFYAASLEAVADLGNMNDASTGKLPSAGIAAKAIYALQYADEQSITEASNLQDEALKRLAQALDAVTRIEYKEARKVRIVGADRSYLIEEEILPEHLDTAADYHFVPGSMLSRQKEAVKNEMFALLEAGLVQPWEVRKNLSTATPDAFRQSYDLQEARARRNLNQILRRGATIQPQPFEDAGVHASVYQEFLLSTAAEAATEAELLQIFGLWQQYSVAAQPQAPPAPAPAVPGQAPAPATPIGASGPAFDTPQGAAALEQAATAATAPPAGYEEAGGAAPS